MAVTLEPTILLLGGGYTLQRLAALLQSGSFVITSRNTAQCSQWRSQGFLSHRVDIEDPATLDSLFESFPLLQVLVDSVPPLRHGADPAVGVKNVVRALPKAKDIKRIIYLSTTGVFGVRDGSVVIEETPPSPWNSQGEARLLSELAYRESGREVTALRLPAIYGPDRGIHVSLRSGTYRIVGDGSMWGNRIHVDDLASVIQKAIEFPYERPLPEVLCVSDDEPMQAREVARYICEQEGLPFPSSISEEEVLHRGGYTMLSNQRVQNARMKELLGITLQYPSIKRLYSRM
jgi:nucleoside-diphosphate-sugar epimerase